MQWVEMANGTYPNILQPIEIYRDTATTLYIDGPEYNPDAYNGQTNLWYKIWNSSTPAIAVIGLTKDDSFDTQISFKQASDDDGDVLKQPLFAYPFDEVSHILAGPCYLNETYRSFIALTVERKYCVLNQLPPGG
jgi:hypothetical protein